jgi:hypothetical protein
MPIITLNKRSSQSSPLSTAQVDANWTSLEAVIANLGGGTGSVTSVGITGDVTSILVVSNSPITGSGNITLNLSSQSANRVFASPSGSNGTPSFRPLVALDLPTVTIAKGGTNSTTALNNNRVMVSSGGAIVESSTIDTTELGFLNGIGSLSAGFLKTAGSALTSSSTISLTSDVSGILPVANGGTGYDSSSAANGRLLIGNGSGFALNTITAGSGISVTNGSGSITIANIGLPSLNGLTGAVSIAAGSSGSDFNIAALAPNVTINIPSSSAANRGLLTSADWSTFNAKEPAVTKGNLTETTSSVLTITGGSSAVIGSGTTIQVKLATASQNGYLSSTDWTTFNNKIGGNFSTVAGGSLTFVYDIWYTSAGATTPQITSGDIGKIIFIKNVNTAVNVTITGYASDTMDGHRSIILGHGASGEGGMMIQATSTTTWYILSTTGSITYSS